MRTRDSDVPASSCKELNTRLKVSVVNMKLPLALRNYTEVRTWLALQRFDRRVRWVRHGCEAETPEGAVTASSAAWRRGWGP